MEKISASSTSKDPLYENGQYLLEQDPQNPDKWSPAAVLAQKAKLKRLMDNRPPCKQIPRSKMPSNGSKPPVYRFGFAFKGEFMLAYARAHGLTMILESDAIRSMFDGKDSMNFADLEDRDLEDKSFRDALIYVATLLVEEELTRRCAFPLVLCYPFSEEWDGMFALWSNYDLRERFGKFIPTKERYQSILATLHAALTTSEHDSQPLWWFDSDNDVGVFTSIE